MDVLAHLCDRKLLHKQLWPHFKAHCSSRVMAPFVSCNAPTKSPAHVNVQQTLTYLPTCARAWEAFSGISPAFGPLLLFILHAATRCAEVAEDRREAMGTPLHRHCNHHDSQGNTHLQHFQHLDLRPSQPRSYVVCACSCRLSHGSATSHASYGRCLLLSGHCLQHVQRTCSRGWVCLAPAPIGSSHSLALTMTEC
jgi:hypothetical protein